MNKSFLLALSLAAAVSLNAAVYATVNGKDVTDEDLAPVLGGDATRINQLPSDAKKNLIDRIVERKLMIDEAKKSGIENDPEYTKSLQSVMDNVAVDIWMKKQFDAIKIDNKKTKDFYDKNKDKFVVPAQTKAKHILVNDEKKAKEIIKTLSSLKGDALTKKFVELAKAESIDRGSADNGGELGWFPQSQMVAEFSKAAFALKKGELTKTPVKTEFGYHVILKEDEKKTTTLGFDQVKKDIENQLRTEEFRVVIQKRAEELRNKAKVEYK